MFKVNVSEVQQSLQTFGQAVNTANDALNTTKDTAANLTNAGEGDWMNSAVGQLANLQAGVDAGHSSLDTLKTSFGNAYNDLNDKIRVQRNDVLSAVGASPDDDNIIKCDPGCNVGPQSENARVAAQTLHDVAQNAVNSAQGLDGSGQEKGSIIASLDNIVTKSSDSAGKLNTLESAWNTFAASVNAFESGYSSQFKTPFMNEATLKKAQASANQVVLNFLGVNASANWSAGADDESKLLKEFHEGNIYIDDEGNLTARGSVDAKALLGRIHADGTAAISLLGVAAQAEFGASAEVGAHFKAQGWINKHGFDAEASVKLASAEVHANARIGDLAELDGKAEAYGGARAKATGTIDEDGVKIEGEAFAGVEAKASGSATIGFLQFSGEASAQAGAGAKGVINIGKGDDKKYHFTVGGSAAVGLGAGAKIDIAVDPKILTDGWRTFCTSIGMVQQ